MRLLGKTGKTGKTMRTHMTTTNAVAKFVVVTIVNAVRLLEECQNVESAAVFGTVTWTVKRRIGKVIGRNVVVWRVCDSTLPQPPSPFFFP